MALTTSIRFAPPIQRKPLVITAAVHMLLLLFLLLWRFSLPAQTPPLPEMGMEVNLGTTANGSGADQPMDMEDPAAEASVASYTMAEAAAEQADVERSDDDDVPSVTDASPDRTARQSVNIATQQHGNAASSAPAQTAQPQRPRYVYAGSSGKGGNSASANMAGTGEGNTTGPGDRGVPRGTPGATNYEGSPGSGTGGISHSLSGRNIVVFPPKEAKFKEGGRVIVHVTVNREGLIVNSRIKSSTNTELNPIARRQLLQVRFNKSEAAPEEQFGDITFVFKTRH